MKRSIHFLVIAFVFYTIFNVIITIVYSLLLNYQVAAGYSVAGIFVSGVVWRVLLFLVFMAVYLVGDAINELVAAQISREGGQVREMSAAQATKVDEENDAASESGDVEGQARLQSGAYYVVR